MKWFKDLFGICSHFFELSEKIEVYETWDGVKLRNPSYYKYVQKCKFCGEIKIIKV